MKRSVANRFGCPVVNYERGLPLRSEPEGLFDVVDLSDDVALRQPADLSFSDHVSWLHTPQWFAVPHRLSGQLSLASILLRWYTV